VLLWSTVLAGAWFIAIESSVAVLLALAGVASFPTIVLYYPVYFVAIAVTGADSSTDSPAVAVITYGTICILQGIFIEVVRGVARYFLDRRRRLRRRAPQV
jgi:hypothetical protein